MATDAPQPSQKIPPDLKVLWTRAALFFAVVGTLGSLHLSLNMGLKACPLCFYQRAFIMSVTAILAFGMFVRVPAAAQTVLALAPATAGLLIAGFHSYLEITGALECPLGVTGLVVAPQESLVIYILMTAALLGDLFHRRVFVLQGIGAALLGYVFYTTCVKGTPPAATPTREYAEEINKDGCRKPYVAPK